jgi:hypothetical protein
MMIVVNIRHVNDEGDRFPGKQEQNSLVEQTKDKANRLRRDNPLNNREREREREP